MEERICCHCGCVISEEENEYYVEDEMICEDCAESATTICDHCEERVWSCETVSDDDITICQCCYDDYYDRCEDCGRLVRDVDVCWHNNLPYCDNCFDDHYDEGIEEYSYKPEPLFKGEGKRFMGVELEVDCGGKDGDNACSIMGIANKQAKHVYIKSDSSLDDGFEIVSHPMTLDYHMNEMCWESLMKEALDLGYRSHKTSTCGLHVHVNRNAFGDNQLEQEEVISRILFFVEKHWAEMFQFSRRSDYNMNRWSARYGFEKTGEEILKKAKNGCNGRYVAVNLKNYHTIEFRLFRGTLKYNTFIATLQMVDKICDVAFSMSEREIDDMSWSAFASTIKEKELIQYLKERRLYVNDVITDEGGEE